MKRTLSLRAGSAAGTPPVLSSASARERDRVRFTSRPPAGEPRPYPPPRRDATGCPTGSVLLWLIGRIGPIGPIRPIRRREALPQLPPITRHRRAVESPAEDLPPRSRGALP